ncbi:MULTISPECIES: DUF1869 domain-containing protein [Dickeya]|uniref:DUF1869 domain-containing protein n=1 Tax=Dickeya fangzhongdai TaxID=1778540 RepID=A0A2K8QLK1_9GAMM|nr:MULTISPECIES: DUF1869 domain-containing protein [Dickeya]ATZ93908.1 DUF1869 domain-containing protein [Dickeya fangzhongdai]AYH47543.1 hypothetical protein B6N31_07510 [Dickeya fangzhongdai]MBO8134063.1 DUF1869 domain-containing protein [Dickeya fangzhongdai]QOH47344.1 DUF1869 domain-containing protein [Dickeya fangzhongdai]QOH51650.1 DUF1869 domain-containing protein [Dickeya fangzhongdai]
MESENKGYSLAIANRDNSEKKEKIFLKPMSLYVPDVAAQAVAALIDELSETSQKGKDFVLTVTNQNNGVSVDKDFAALSELKDPAIAADAVKELINIVRGYESDEETNVCGW